MIDNSQRLTQIEERLKSLSPTKLEVIDESHLHAGHAGARSGKGHFRVRISAPELANLRRIQQHQKIYAALDEMMQTDIHALAIEIE